MKVILQELKMGTAKEWFLVVDDDRSKAPAQERCWLLLPEQKQRVEEIIKELRAL